MRDPASDTFRVCLIGAGLTGLVAARQLLAAGFDVVLLESSAETGGMAASFQIGSDRIEYIYHHIFTSDTDIIDLIRELGLYDQLHWHTSCDALYQDGRLHPFSTPLDLLRFPSIPLLQRLRTGLAVLKAGRLRDWQLLEGQTAAEWLQANGGPAAYQRIWQPLLRAKFDQDADDVSAVWIWNKFKLRGQSRDARSRRGRLGYLSGSFGNLVDRLTEGIRDQGGQILCGHTAMNISRTGSRYRISCILENCSTVNIEADAVIATVSGRQFAGLTTSLDLPEDYRRRVSKIRYKGNLCLILRLKHALSPYYWTTICDALPFVVVVEHTNLVGSDTYGGHLVYVSRYLDVADPLWTQPDGDIYRLFIRGLAQVYAHFSPRDVLDWRLCRTRYAQPVIGRHYSRQMPAADTPDPGIKLAGMAQIYPEDRGMNYAVRLGCQVARSLIRQQLDPDGSGSLNASGHDQQASQIRQQEGLNGEP